MKLFKYIYRIAFIILVMTSCTPKSQMTKVVKVEKQNEKFTLTVDGKPFYVKGGGLEFGNMKALKRHGGNAFRTWRFDNGKHTGLEVLDKAQEEGLMVVMGLEIEKERHGFNYDDEEAVNKQYQKIIEEVKQMKDHPALLAYGLGNELNLRYTNPKVWDAVNQIAEGINNIDPNHPTSTMLAGADKDVIQEIMKRCPAIDFLSFQVYADIVNLPKYIDESGYLGPYFITEWGATGHWEVGQTSWGRPIEQNSEQKAQDYLMRYQEVIEKESDRCLGSFVFLWGQKQERTPTWYGLFLESGEETATIDAMHYAWNKEWPTNRTPQLEDFLLDNKNAYQNIILKQETDYTATVFVTDIENDSLHYQWEILKEVDDELKSDGGDYEPSPEKLFRMNTSNEMNEVQIKTPKMPGEYRLFVYVHDGNHHAATANIPFLVEK